MGRPSAQRLAVRYIQQVYGLSDWSACRALGAPRATHRYDSRRPAAEGWTARLRELAIQRPRFGYRRLYLLLRREGVVVNHERVYRVYRSEGLTVRSSDANASQRLPGPLRPCRMRLASAGRWIL